MKTAAQGKTVPVPYGRRAPHMVPPARTPQRKERFRTLTREYLVCGGKPLFGEVTISGAKNAAVLAAQILAVSDPDLAAKLDQARSEMAAQIAQKELALQAELS